MQKYHKEIGFYPCHIAEAKALIMALKWRKIGFSFHALEELGAESDAQEIGCFLVNYELNFNDVFEIALNEGKIEKIGFRVTYGKRDVIFILSREKRVITLWTNELNDKHFTLNSNNYIRPLISIS